MAPLALIAAVLLAGAGAVAAGPGPQWNGDASLVVMGGPRPSAGSATRWTQCARLELANPVALAGRWSGRVVLEGGRMVSAVASTATMDKEDEAYTLRAVDGDYAIGPLGKVSLLEFCVDYAGQWAALPDIKIAPEDDDYMEVRVQSQRMLVKRQAGFSPDWSSGNCKCLWNGAALLPPASPADSKPVSTTAAARTTTVPAQTTTVRAQTTTASTTGTQTRASSTTSATFTTVTTSQTTTTRFTTTAAVAATCSPAALPTMKSITSCPGTGLVFAGGSGTSASPYLVSTLTHLNYIRTAGYLSCAFKQTAAIAAAGWIPIGSNTAKFTGSYDGAEFPITGLTMINAASAAIATRYWGLFGYVANASIFNVRAEVNITAPRSATSTNEGRYCGAVAGWADASTFVNCKGSGYVRCGQVTGGLLGGANPPLQVWRSSASATIINNGGWEAGGLIGGIEDVSMGAGPTIVSESFATGSVSGVYFTGGLVGAMWPTTANSVTIQRCYATGAVSATLNGTGGLVGLISEPENNNWMLVKDSWASGSVTSGTGAVGGLVGNFLRSSSATNKNTIQNCYAIGAVSGSGSYIGGLVGQLVRDDVTTYPYADVLASFWNPTDAGASAVYASGTSSTRSDMKSRTLYTNVGWNMTDKWSSCSTWTQCSGNYPYLNWAYNSSNAPCV